MNLYAARIWITGSWEGIMIPDLAVTLSGMKPRKLQVCDLAKTLAKERRTDV